MKRRKFRKIRFLMVIVVLALAAGGTDPAAMAMDAPGLTIEPQGLPPSQDARYDFDTLAEKLKKTGAIGFVAKLKLKLSFDALIKDVNRHHTSGNPDERISALRNRFDALVRKTRQLLQKTDPALSRELVLASNTIWDSMNRHATLRPASRRHAHHLPAR